MKDFLISIVNGEYLNVNTKNIIRIDQITTYLKNHHKDIYKEIINSDKNGSNFVYDIINNIKENPKCLYCDKKVKFRNFVYGYNKYCSNKCQLKSNHEKFEKEGYPYKRESVLNEMKNNNLEKYGVEYPFQSKEYQKMMEHVYFSKTGFKKSICNPEVSKKVSYSLSNKTKEEWEDINDKRKQTNLEKYGTEIFVQSDDFKEKTLKTNLEKYGETHHMKNKKHLKDIHFSEKASLCIAKYYSNFLNTEDNDLKGIVYVLHFMNLKAIKIGLTTNFKKREKELIKDFGEFKIIDLIETDYCRKLESELHSLYDNERICLSAGCGKTEFFKECILEEIKEWLK